jgi:hypothetical protein
MRKKRTSKYLTTDIPDSGIPLKLVSLILQNENELKVPTEKDL